MIYRKRPSPALVVALVALFVSLSGTAVAAGIVPLAKRALTADKAKVSDNARKLGGQTSAALLARAAGMPGPASSAGGLVTVKQVADSLAADSGREFVVACDGGRKVISGGFASDGSVVPMDSRPMSDTAWGLYLLNLDDTGMGVRLYAVCIG